MLRRMEGRFYPPCCILEGECLMANITKYKRDEMLALLEQLKVEHNDDASIRAFNEIQNHLTEKKFGLVFEEHTEAVDEKLTTHIPILCADESRRICKDESKPWNFLVEGDNLQALYLLEKTHRGKVDCIYIDPPYNTGAKDWKYNNDYVDGQDVYRHSKWLSMMKTRLMIAKRLLNPRDSVLIVSIDEKEYLHLGCL
jgi:adenine-specific DNA-methyltransferase